MKIINLQAEANKKCGYTVILVAELSANHGSSLEIALKSIEVAAEAGVDAVKIQTLQPEKITLDSDSSEFKVVGGLWDGRHLIDLYKEAYTPWEWLPKLQSKAKQCGVNLFSSPFDVEAVDFLISNNVPALKIASAEAIDVNFVRYCSSFGLPIILSSGMSTLEELEAARDIILANKCELTILHCIADYPAEIDKMNIATIPYMKNTLHHSIGLSDHSISSHASASAVVFGVNMIEKHFSIMPANKTLDGEFSLNSSQLKTWVSEVRMFEKVLGTPNIGIKDNEVKNKKFRRSLYFIEDLNKGSIIKDEHVASVRPANGLHPKFLKEIIGMKIRRNINKYTPVCWEDLE